VSSKLKVAGSNPAGVANQTYEIAALYGLRQGLWGGFYWRHRHRTGIRSVAPRREPSLWRQGIAS
jgi:hypothetical protein